MQWRLNMCGREASIQNEPRGLGRQRTDNKLVRQAIYPSFIQLTCGGNIVKGVHDKKLTPWLALKTFWATDCETVKKQQMREKRGWRESACVFFWKDFCFVFLFKHGRPVTQAK